MKSATKQYREDMKSPFRNKWGLEMYIGLIREKFQSKAYSEISSPVSFLSRNHDEQLYKNTPVLNRVATFEENMFKANGEPIFSDKNGISLENGYYGLVSEDISDSGGNLTFTVAFKSKTDEKGLKGLTLSFLDNYPTKLNITAYDGNSQVFTKDYTNDSLMFTTIDVFGENSDKLVLTIKKMNKPYVRFRMSYVLFGVGVFFGNKDFISSTGSYKETFHPCSAELPTKEFNFSLDNIDKAYDIDNPDSLIRLANIGQDISFHTTYTHDDGSIEILPGEKLELASFDNAKNSLKIKAVDFLRNENSEVVIDKPEQFPVGATLYDMVEIVKKNLKNETFTIALDSALKDIPIKYTHISASCKDALMMIAGAARCVMELTETGVNIRRLTYSDSTLSARSDNGTPYSNFVNFFSPEDAVSVASFEQNKVSANKMTVFPSNEPSDTIKVGYISESISDTYGNFGNPPKIEIISKEALSTDYVYIRFNNTLKNAVIKTYYDNTFLESVNLDNIKKSEIALTKRFKSFNKMTIQIDSIYEPDRRLQCDYVSFNSAIYELNKSLCSSEPTMKMEDNIKNIIVKYTYFDSEKDEDVSDKVTIVCNLTGSDIEYDNPFITSEKVAMDVGNWLKNYYKTQIYYDINIVGDPTLQINDIVKLPSEYNDRLLATIEENEVSFRNGGIRGKMKTRREK